MQLTCPHCGFSKNVAKERLPASASQVGCPRCRKVFPLPQTEPLAEPEAETSSAPEKPEPPRSILNDPRKAPVASPNHAPKAGFWIRLTAWSLDKILVAILQILLGSLLYLAGSSLVPAPHADPAKTAELVWLFTLALNGVYYVFFTGYLGQTPGKMALRIRVIRSNGRPIGYGRAFIREIPGKFISAILFGIGYLMVAFDEQKQGLHDRLADTYVIKL